MDMMDMNSLQSFVEEIEVSCEAIQNKLSLDEDDPIENEIAVCISQIEGAVLELYRYLADLSIRKYLPNFPLDK